VRIDCILIHGRNAGKGITMTFAEARETFYARCDENITDSIVLFDVISADSLQSENKSLMLASNDDLHELLEM
jgi:hypothetical protein